MKVLYVKCDEPYFEETELMLFEIELKERPWFDCIKLICGWDTYTYKVKEEFGKWYITI